MIYKPFFEAIKKILDGNPVQELDDIRNQCDAKFLVVSKSQAHPRGYSPEAIVISFVADAENRILMGGDPIEIYSSVAKDLSPEEFRERSRTILENSVKKYF